VKQNCITQLNSKLSKYN